MDFIIMHAHFFPAYADVSAVIAIESDTWGLQYRQWRASCTWQPNSIGLRQTIDLEFLDNCPADFSFQMAMHIIQITLYILNGVFVLLADQCSVLLQIFEQIRGGIHWVHTR